jgi:hypothetical protein
MIVPKGAQMPRSPIRIPRSEQGSYFCRVDRASFNLTNLVEDTVESVTAFALRYVYTNLILLWSPRAVVFHILKHNRWFRITRPYSYGFASFFVLILAVSVTNAFNKDDTLGAFFQWLFGGSFSLSEFAKSPSAVTLLFTSAPALLSLFVAAWASAAVTALILVPPRRERRLFAPIYFGLTYIIALLLIMLGLAAVAEFLFRAFVAAPNSGGGFLGPDFMFYEGRAIAVFAILLVVLGVTLCRMLWAFSAVAGKARGRRGSRVVRVALAWVFAFCSIWGAIALAALISIGVRVLSEPSPAPPANAQLACFGRSTDVAFAGGGVAPAFQQSFSKKPFLGQSFAIVVKNDGDADVDLQEDVALSGEWAACTDLKNVRSCKKQCETCRGDTGTAKIVEPQPIGGVIIVPKKGMVGVRVRVSALSREAEVAQYVSLPDFKFESTRFPDLTQASENKCEPFQSDAFSNLFKDK